MVENQLPAKIQFAENKIQYGQDFRFSRGIPAGIEFEIQKLSDTKIKLVAPGYGGKPYGNGALFVNVSALKLPPNNANARDAWMVCE